MSLKLPTCDDVTWIDLDSIETAGSDCVMLVGDKAFFSRLPYSFERFFVLSARSAVKRGSHAHRACWQTFFVVHGDGPVLVEVYDGLSRVCWEMMPGHRLLTIPPGLWVEVRFNDAASVMVLCSHEYAETDYIRDLSDFIRFRGGDL